MFGSSLNGANAYSKIGVETGVIAASPTQLIIMLFTGAMLAVSSASQHMRAGEIEAKGKAISKAVAIIDEGLRASLDKKVGGEIALNLDALYEYMSTRLLQANLKNQLETLDEIYGLLKGLKEAWETMDNTGKPVEQIIEAPTQQRAQGYDALAPQSNRLVKA
tara:strand:- start:203984 stop:204472 length:489 start_codon:yes stop_codon:yes gene_type:complete